MKKLLLIFICSICCSSGFAKDPEPKTFLALFKAKELKELKTSLKQIESQFSDVFKTKTYAGNSELALLIEIPACDFDECFLGEFLINLDESRKMQLQNIAFRVFDLTENKDLHQTYLALYEESQSKKKKDSKTAKLSSGLLGGPGH
ncbi:MAG: hypothetical protein LPK25_09040 [Cyclobacteriaceae bacterium]|nr:hypothetical protein [Cyclobacteriaceae bacterium]MDX5466751.1 hypothetical protein [Cyclobacteriaceae bacterium]